MKRIVISAAILVAAITGTGVVLVSSGQDPQPVPVEGKINWMFDYERAQQLARERGQPMFVVFRCER